MMSVIDLTPKKDGPWAEPRYLSRAQCLSHGRNRRCPCDYISLSYDDCLENKRKDCQNCSVPCCVRQLYTTICTHTHEQFLKLSVGLSFVLVFVHLFRFSILCVFRPHRSTTYLDAAYCY